MYFIAMASKARQLQQEPTKTLQRQTAEPGRTTAGPRKASRRASHGKPLPCKNRRTLQTNPRERAEHRGTIGHALPFQALKGIREAGSGARRPRLAVGIGFEPKVLPGLSVLSAALPVHSVFEASLRPAAARAETLRLKAGTVAFFF